MQFAGNEIIEFIVFEGVQRKKASEMKTLKMGPEIKSVRNENSKGGSRDEKF